MRTFLFIICIPFFSTYSVEIILSNGDIFIADYVSEDNSQYTIKWKTETYTIPKSEILKVDLKKVGPNKSFRPIEYSLQDGSKVRGIIVEDSKTSYTLKTELGFLKLDKEKISETKGESKEDFPPPRSFNDQKLTKNYTNFGIYASGYTMNGIFQTNYPTGFAGGFFFEPSIFQLSSKIRFGFSLESFQSMYKKSNLILETYNLYQAFQTSKTFYALYQFSKFNQKYNLSIQSFFSYFQLRFNLSNWFDFFIHLGLGASSINSSETNLSGILPSTLIQIGYQGFSFNRVLIRLSAKSVLLFETGNSIRNDGGEFSLGYAI